MKAANPKELQTSKGCSQCQTYSDSTDDETSLECDFNKQIGVKINKTKYKTELCKNFSEMGWCKYGDKCQYAHGYNDVTLATIKNKKSGYRTRKCKSFWNQGKCPYGKRCQFSHYQSNATDKLCRAYLSIQLYLIQDCNFNGQSKLLSLLKN